MDHLNFALVSVVINVALLLMQWHTAAKVAELKVYMHEKFVLK